ncbi:uncharacterized protein LOC105261636 [Musca domestica]|uniref:Uncharacterized protein LOC105261636 n=1 Tax=Musca domestica TaxID=7370 RepID=A0A1I8NKE5_MUSDO|nr:uncharacterized protein LOC105261636 [Musca domestica]
MIITEFINSSDPSTFMEKFCRSIHPDLDLGTTCINWFRQATTKCSTLMANVKDPTKHLWASLMDFIFPERQTGLISKQIPLTMHPHHLTLDDCQSLFNDIVEDYVRRAPRYSEETKTVVRLWQILYSMVGIMFLLSLLLFVKYLHGRGRRPLKIAAKAEECSHPTKCLQAAARRSLNLAKCENRHLRVLPLVQPAELITPDGAPVLAIKLKSKYDLIGSKKILGTMEADSRLYSALKNDERALKECKIQTIAKALEIIGNTTRKLHLLICFEDDAIFEEEILEKTKVEELIPQKSKIPVIPSKIKSPTSLRRKASPKTSGVENLGKSSPRFGGNVNRKPVDSIGDSGSPRSSFISKRSSVMSTASSPSHSPRKAIAVQKNRKTSQNTSPRK